jgi:hypothetical protein
MISDNYSGHSTHSYVGAFARWMKDAWKPTAFVTIRLRRAGGMPRSERFYLTLLANRAEADVLGAHSLKMPDDGRRIRWIARREHGGTNSLSRPRELLDPVVEG